MQLTVIERIGLLSILPEHGNFITLKIVRQLREALSFTEDEIKILEIKQDGNQVVWNPAVNPEGTNIPVGEKATDVIVDSLKKLNEENKLTAQHLTLYEKFVEK